MSDGRRNTELKEVKNAIVKILVSKPLQAKDLRKALKKMNKNFGYSRDRLNDLLNQMRNGGNIERIMLKDNPYPVYSVLTNSKILAEFNGNAFRVLFEDGMFKNCGILLNEFEASTLKNNKADALLKFFGFYVLGSLMASRLYDKKLRSDWLKPVLDLEKDKSMSYFLDELVTEKRLLDIARLLSQNYKDNMRTLSESVKASKNVKKITNNSKGLMKLFNDFNQKLS